MQASVGGLVWFIVMLFALKGLGVDVTATSWFTLLFLAYVPVYFGISVLIDWLATRRRERIQRRAAAE